MRGDRQPGLGWLAAGAVVLAGCHLVAGIEEAELIETVVGNCSVDAGCNDDNPCTVDRCIAAECSYEELDGDAPESLQTSGDCQHAVCAAGELAFVVDDGDLPHDGFFCTNDLCVDGSPENVPLAGGAPCDESGGKVCNGEGKCVDCFSNADCILPDTCGGAGTAGACGCTPIQCSAVNLTCGFHPDDGCGGVLPCNNATQDGGETDVDCGGPVSTCSTRCGAGKACVAPNGSDCASGLCCDQICCANGETCNAGLCE